MHWLPAILILPYFFLLLKLYRSLFKIKIFYASTEPVTFVSVVVACRNEQKNLPALLNSIAHQNYPEYLFEVIIIVDNSTDKTFEIAEGFTGISNILTLYNKGKGKKQALRTGITAAKGNLVITTDADCRMGTDWIRTIASFFEESSPDMIICPVQIESTRGLFGRFQELEFISLQGITAGCALLNNPTMCNGANLAFKRERYFNHTEDLHDEINSGDDIFLLHSLKKDNEAKIEWLESTAALVTTESASSFASYIKQRKRWISKGKAYKDRSTIFLAIATFIAILLQVVYLAGVFIMPSLIAVFLVIFLLKSVPDFLILNNTCTRYNNTSLIKWFLPCQLLYPFYVLMVVFYSLIFRRE
jgi:cellulose synthase/poly-beta-1,6-N-acetylglucosamine synthase-like glycosyltransferase